MRNRPIGRNAESPVGSFASSGRRCARASPGSGSRTRTRWRRTPASPRKTRRPTAVSREPGSIGVASVDDAAPLMAAPGRCPGRARGVPSWWSCRAGSSSSRRGGAWCSLRVARSAWSSIAPPSSTSQVEGPPHRGEDRVAMRSPPARVKWIPSALRTWVTMDRPGSGARRRTVPAGAAGVPMTAAVST